MGCAATPAGGPAARIAASYLVSDYKKAGGEVSSLHRFTHIVRAGPDQYASNGLSRSQAARPGGHYRPMNSALTLRSGSQITL